RACGASQVSSVRLRWAITLSLSAPEIPSIVISPFLLAAQAGQASRLRHTASAWIRLWRRLARQPVVLRTAHVRYTLVIMILARQRASVTGILPMRQAQGLWHGPERSEQGRLFSPAQDC